MKKISEGNIQVSVKLKKSTYEALQTLAAKNSKPIAEVIRGYINRGLNIEKTKDDIDFIRSNIREELDSVMSGYMNRLIKLNIKIGMMTVTMCYFTSELLYIILKPHQNLDYGEMMGVAKKKAGTFLGMRDESIDEVTKSMLYKGD